jgi:hypothetical protein
VKQISSETAEKARLILRRICGFLPPGGMAIAFVMASRYSPHEKQCFILAGISGGVGLILWLLLDQYQRWEQKYSDGQEDERQLLFDQYQRWEQKSNGASQGRYIPRRFNSVGAIWANPQTRGAIGIAWTVSVFWFVGLTCSPVGWGQSLGSPAVVLFAIAAWISAGSLILYWANCYRVPIITFLLLWVVFCSRFNDNHDVRILGPEHSGKKPMTITGALDEWYKGVSIAYPMKDTNQLRPLYLVASAGGGIRAAYWTAIVLGELENRARSNGTSFAAQTFAMSGVSGGALGEMTFTALQVPCPKPTTDFHTSARRLLAKDFLAANLAKMAFADLFQQFWFCPVKKWDRAASLEDAWAAAWQEEFHTNVLEQSLGEFYDRAFETHILVPHLFFTGTCVETGGRVITSDLDIHSSGIGHSGPAGDFLEAVAAADKLTNAPIRLSTAVHQSARFTYFSPAGRFPADGTHVVDGGYFENSGATTLVDVLAAIKRHIDNRKLKIQPRLVLIDNDPIPLEPRINHHSFMRESLSPVLALLNTRTARGIYAFEQARDYDRREDNGSGEDKVFVFHLYERGPGEPLGKLTRPGDLPLGWTLSHSAINEMEAQLMFPFARATNLMNISKIIETLKH